MFKFMNMGPCELPIENIHGHVMNILFETPSSIRNFGVTVAITRRKIVRQIIYLKIKLRKQNYIKSINLFEI